MIMRMTDDDDDRDFFFPTEPPADRNFCDLNIAPALMSNWRFMPMAHGRRAVRVDAAVTRVPAPKMSAARRRAEQRKREECFNQTLYFG